MSHVVVRNRHLLQYLVSGNTKLVRSIIRNSDASLIRAISEIALNILTVDLELTSKQKRSLRRYKPQLRLLADKGTSLASKKRCLNPLFLRKLLTVGLEKLGYDG